MAPSRATGSNPRRAAARRLVGLLALLALLGGVDGALAAPSLLCCSPLRAACVPAVLSPLRAALRLTRDGRGAQARGRATTSRTARRAAR